MTAAKKATTTKTTPRAAAPKDAKEAPAAPAPKMVTFQGREIEVKLPTGEQIAAWYVLAEKLKAMDTTTTTMEQVVTLVGRANKIISAVVVKEEDRDWLEDGRLDGTVTIEDSTVIVIDTLKRFSDSVPGTEVPNRAARRRKA